MSVVTYIIGAFLTNLNKYFLAYLIIKLIK
jgi:hypothetical protein